MKNCLIFGSGRSGTSMLGGMLHSAGYFLGDNLYPPRSSNPKGFFENDFINGINEDILRGYDSWWCVLKNKITLSTNVCSPGKGQHWLSSIAKDVDINKCKPEVVKSIKEACSADGFAYKDPRFSYTLPVWKEYLPEGTRYIVIFRDPRTVVNSILKECASIPYLSSMRINAGDAYSVWVNMHSHILKNYETDPGKYFFVNYESLLTGKKIEQMSEFLSADISGEFIDHSLKRSTHSTEMPIPAKKIYGNLNALADHE